MTTLGKKTTSALSWSALERITNQGLTFVIVVLLARLVGPEEFGLLALLAIFILLSQLLIDSGLGMAIIQKKEISREDISTVFYFNLLGAIVIYAVLFLAAPYIADFYAEPRLTLLLRVVGLAIIINALGKIQQNLLIRDLRFKELFKITTPALIIGGIAGITGALNGMLVWSLVVYRLTTASIQTICFWLFSSRQSWPRWEFSFESLKSMWRFAVGILGTSLLYNGVQNIYGLLIGKAFSFEQLGLYDRARSFQREPSTFLTRTINRVMFPAFATIQDDNSRIRSALRVGIPIIAFAVFAFMAALVN